MKIIKRSWCSLVAWWRLLAVYRLIKEQDTWDVEETELSEDYRSITGTVSEDLITSVPERVEIVQYSFDGVSEKQGKKFNTFTVKYWGPLKFLGSAQIIVTFSKRKLEVIKTARFDLRDDDLSRLHRFLSVRVGILIMRIVRRHYSVE